VAEDGAYQGQRQCPSASLRFPMVPIFWRMSRPNGIHDHWPTVFDLAQERTARGMIVRQTGGIVTAIVERPDTRGNTLPCTAKGVP
jgi:hypothetical protein